MSKKIEKQEKDITIDTMARIGKKITLAGREYTICPINVEDMGILLNSELFVPTKKQLESGEINLSFFGLNVTDEDKEEVFYRVVKKYLRYIDTPVTKEMVIEHNWSFTDIKDFLYGWIEASE